MGSNSRLRGDSPERGHRARRVPARVNAGFGRPRRVVCGRRSCMLPLGSGCQGQSRGSRAQRRPRREEQGAPPRRTPWSQARPPENEVPGGPRQSRRPPRGGARAPRSAAGTGAAGAAGDAEQPGGPSPRPEGARARRGTRVSARPMRGKGGSEELGHDAAATCRDRAAAAPREPP